ncbi:MAG: hypothetical protein ACPGYT_12240 [Nitrospirales bacterium]
MPTALTKNALSFLSFLCWIVISVLLIASNGQTQDLTTDVKTLDNQLAEAKRQIDHLEELGLRKAKDQNISIVKVEGQWLAMDASQMKGKIPALATIIHSVLSDSPTAQGVVGSRLGKEVKKTASSIGTNLGLGKGLTDAFAELVGDMASKAGKQSAADGHISQKKLEGQMAKEFEEWIESHSISSESLAQEQVRWSNRYQEIDKQITKTLQEEESAKATNKVAKNLETELRNIHDTFAPIQMQVNTFRHELWEAQKPLRNSIRAEDVHRLDETAQEILATTENVDVLTKKIQVADRAYSDALLTFSKVSNHVQKTQSDVCRKVHQAESLKAASLDSLQQIQVATQKELEDRQDVLDVTYENVKRKRTSLERAKELLAELLPKVGRFRQSENWDNLVRLRQALDGKNQAKARLEKARQNRTKLPGNYQELRGSTITALERISTSANVLANSLNNQNAETLRNRFLKIQGRTVGNLGEIKALPLALPKVPTLLEALAPRSDIALGAFEKLPTLIQLAEAQRDLLKSLEVKANATLSKTDSILATALSRKAYDDALKQAHGCYQKLTRLIQEKASARADGYNGQGQGAGGGRDENGNSDENNPDQQNQQRDSTADDLAIAKELRGELNRIKAEKAQYDQRYAFLKKQIPLLYRTLTENAQIKTNEKTTYPPRGNPLNAKVKAAFDDYQKAHSTFDAYRARLSQAQAKSCSVAQRTASPNAQLNINLESTYRFVEQALENHATQLQTVTNEIDTKKHHLIKANKELLNFSNELDSFLTSLTEGMKEDMQKARAIYQKAQTHHNQPLGHYPSTSDWWTGVLVELGRLAAKMDEHNKTQAKDLAQQARSLLHEIRGSKIELHPLRDYVEYIVRLYSIPELLQLRDQVKEHLELSSNLHADGTMNKLEALDNLERMKACKDTLYATLQAQNSAPPSNDLTDGFPEDPDDSSPTDTDSPTAAQRQATEEFAGNHPTSDSTQPNPEHRVTGNSDDSSPFDVADKAQTERDKEREKDKNREQAIRSKDEENQQQQQKANRHEEQNRQNQNHAARDRKQQAQDQGQSRIDDARNASDPRMSASDMAQRTQAIDDKTDAATAQIDQDIATILSPRAAPPRGTPSTSPTGGNTGGTQRGTPNPPPGGGGTTTPPSTSPTGSSAQNARCKTFVKQAEQFNQKMLKWTRALQSAKSNDERKRLAPEHDRLTRESIRIYNQIQAAGCAPALPRQAREALESVRQQLGSSQAPTTQSPSSFGQSPGANLPCNRRDCSGGVFGLGQ